jgi:hypothetical protein
LNVGLAARNVGVAAGSRVLDLPTPAAYLDRDTDLVLKAVFTGEFGQSDDEPEGAHMTVQLGPEYSGGSDRLGSGSFGGIRHLQICVDDPWQCRSLGG